MFGDGFFQFQDNKVSFKQAPGHNNTISQPGRCFFNLTGQTGWVVLLQLSSDRKTFLSVKHGKLSIVNFERQALFSKDIPCGTKLSDTRDFLSS